MSCRRDGARLPPPVPGLNIRKRTPSLAALMYLEASLRSTKPVQGTFHAVMGAVPKVVLVGMEPVAARLGG